MIGVETNTKMSISRGSSCPIWVRTGNVLVDEMVIVQAPTNGLLRTRGRTGVVYRPADRLTGEDSFAFKVVGRDGAVEKTTIVRVSVNVQ
jgi:hypothetical protein